MYHDSIINLFTSRPFLTRQAMSHMILYFVSVELFSTMYPTQARAYLWLFKLDVRNQICKPFVNLPFTTVHIVHALRHAMSSTWKGEDASFSISAAGVVAVVVAACLEWAVNQGIYRALYYMSVYATHSIRAINHYIFFVFQLVGNSSGSIDFLL